MDKFTSWLQERKDEISLAIKYWPPILKKSIISSVVWWAGALGLMFIATLISFALTYIQRGTVETSNFFFPNFVWGVLIGIAMIFLYQVVIETATRLDKYKTDADKYTWKDIEIKPFVFQSGNVMGNIVGLEIISNKFRHTVTKQEFSITVEKITVEEFRRGTTVKETGEELSLLATDLVVFHPTTSLQNRRELNNKENWIRHVVVPIARWEKSSAWITTSSKFALPRDEWCRIVIGFKDWRLDNSDVMKSGCAVWCDLRYVEDKKGQMVEIKIVKRNPEYER